MRRNMCKDLLIINNKCSCGGIFEIVFDIWFDGSKYYYLKCNKCGDTFDE